MSAPMVSISSKGPILKPIPRNASSIASTLARPSPRMRIDSRYSGRATRLTMKPGVSDATTGVLPSRRAASAVASTTGGSVIGPATTSTRAISGTGLKKCIPSTRSGLWAAAAIWAMERELVFVARIVSSGAAASSWWKASRFMARSSGIASTTRSARASSPSPDDWPIRANAKADSSSLISPFSALRRRKPLIRSRARSYAPGIGSCTTTSRPASAATCATPAPMVPAPSTPTRSTWRSSRPCDTCLSRLAAVEARLALLGEGGHTLGVILRSTRKLLERDLHREPFVETRAVRLVDDALGKTNRARGTDRQALRNRRGVASQLRGGEHAVDQPRRRRFRGGERIAGDREFQGPMPAEGADQDADDARIGHQADAGERQDEARLV